MIKPDNQASVDFLQKYTPDGPWVLTCISTDRKGVDTKTFTDPKPTLNWLEKWNGKRNVYFHVNPTTQAVTRKANREQIASLSWLHVDIDPRAGEDIEEERKRCLGLLTNKLPTGVPDPTCVIFSGGGYQGFWRLKEPVPIDGDLPKAEDAKLWNLQLEMLFGGDNCHNVDRIMRLPGTINIPDARKKKRGRVEVLAELVSFNDNEYPITGFQKAAQVQIKDEGFTSAKPKVDVGTDVERIMDLDELDAWDVPNRVKIIIAQGLHPDEPKEGDNSRSAWVLDVCANLVRKKVPDRIVYAIITDPEWGISESIVEIKGAGMHKYAIRQIERGHEFAKDPWLEKFNRKYAVIGSMGGKCVIVSEFVDPMLKRSRLVVTSFGDFKNRYCNKYVKVGETKEGLPKYEKLGKWWLDHPDRRQYDTIIFAPDMEIPNVYNLWKGFACEAIPGDCGLFLDHIRDNLCCGDDEHFAYAMCWLARMIQKPATPGEVAIVLRGGRGTGKSFFATQVGSLLGRHYLQVASGDHLTGNFNAHLRDLVLLFADEAFFAGDKKHASILKALITELTLTIEKKGIDVENSPNFIHLIMASNDKHVVPAGEMERRFFVLDVGTEAQQNTKYFKAIADQMDNGGREALLHLLREYDLSNFNVRDVPQTDALQNQKLLSLDAESSWWFTKLNGGEIFEDGGEWPREVISSQLAEDFVNSIKRFNVRDKASDVSLGFFLRRILPGELTRQRKSVKIERQMADGYIKTETKSVWHHIIPALSDCRDYWESIYGKTEWLGIEEQPSLSQTTNEPF